MLSQFIVALTAGRPWLDGWLLLATAPAAPGAPAPAGPPPAEGGWMLIALPLAFIGVYLLMTASQTKRQKEHAKMLEAIKPGDEIVTVGGIFGTVTQVKPDSLVVEIAKGTRVELRKTHVESRPAPAQEKTGT